MKYYKLLAPANNLISYQCGGIVIIFIFYFILFRSGATLKMISTINPRQKASIFIFFDTCRRWWYPSRGFICSFLLSDPKQTQQERIRMISGTQIAFKLGRREIILSSASFLCSVCVYREIFGHRRRDKIYIGHKSSLGTITINQEGTMKADIYDYCVRRSFWATSLVTWWSSESEWNFFLSSLVLHMDRA